ncbi:MAG: hypothetical protein QOD42_31 [Sphingomonadales bacterium]|nr:hypothetical protein [Sphingomonadales bacterium]
MGGELVPDPDGRLWHIAYVPLHWSDGTPAKAEWTKEQHERLAGLLNQRFAQAAHYHSPTRFWNLVIGKMEFSVPILNADLSGCYFDSEVAFPGIAGETSIRSCFFRGTVVFFRMAFEKASLTLNVFADGMRAFRVAIGGDGQFKWNKFFGQSLFDDVLVEGDLDFSQCVFLGPFGMKKSRVSGSCTFEGTTFVESVGFGSTRFSGSISFDHARFASGLSFSSAEFSDAAFFTNMKWDGQSLDYPGAPPPYERAFCNTRFKGPAVFQGSGSGHFAAFDGAIFESSVLIDEVSEREAKALFRDELEIARRLGEKRLDALRGGCHKLRHVMERASDKKREILLYQFELRTRRHQAKYPRWERAVSYFYGLASDYGASVGRPIGALFATLIMFGLVYALIGGGASGALDIHRPIGPAREALAPVFEGISYSAGRTFPFGPWAVADDSAFRQALTGDGSTLGSVLVRLLATVQSILSAVLIFLSVMAVRRRFQIG